MKVWIGMLVLLVTIVTPAIGEDLKIGYIDIQRALNESDEGQRAKKRFKEQLDRLQEDLAKQKDQVDALKDQLAKKALVMKEEERRNLEKEYQRKLREFERAYEDTQGELQLKDSELTRDLIQDIQVVIQAYGRKGGYDFILEQSGSGLLYGDSKLDITDDIIKAYDQK
jgi:outer membrane protein